MLKRILSALLVLTVLLVTAATTVTVSAATATTAEPYVIKNWNGTIVTDTAGTTSVGPLKSANLYPTAGINTQRYQISLLSGGTGTGLTAVERSTGDNCYTIDYSKDLRYDPGTNFNFYSQVTNEKLNKPVFSVMYDIMIPNDANANAERTFTPSFTTANGKNGALGSTDYGEFVVKYANGAFTVDSLVGFDSTTVVTDTASYTPGSWATVEVRAYYDATTTKLTYGVYVGDKQIMYGVGTTLYPSVIYLDRALWHQPSLATNYDNISMRTLAVEDKPVTFTAEEPEPEEPEEPETPAGPEITRLVLWNFDDLATTSTTNSLIVSYVSDGNLLYNPRTIAHSSDSNRNTDYVGEARENNGMALVVTTGTTPIDENDVIKDTVLVNNTRRNYNTYVQNDGKEYVVEHSYEIYIPSASADTKRSYRFGFNLTGQNTNDYFVESTIENEKMKFAVNPITDNVKFVDFTERTKVADLPSDAWNKISFIKSIIYDETNSLYNIKIYGICNDVCYYEAQFKGINATNLYMVTQSWNITGLDEKAVVTKFDNIKISSWSAMPEISYGWTDEDNYIYPLALNYVDGSVEAKAKIIGSYNNLCLVVAVYDENGALEKLWTDTTPEDGYLSYIVTGAEYVKSGYSVKAFLFDSLTSAIPQVNSSKLTIQ